MSREVGGGSSPPGPISALRRPRACPRRSRSRPACTPGTSTTRASSAFWTTSRKWRPSTRIPGGADALRTKAAHQPPLSAQPRAHDVAGRIPAVPAPEDEAVSRIKPRLSDHDWLSQTNWLKTMVEAARRRGLKTVSSCRTPRWTCNAPQPSSRTVFNGTSSETRASSTVAVSRCARQSNAGNMCSTCSATLRRITMSIISRPACFLSCPEMRRRGDVLRFLRPGGAGGRFRPRTCPHGVEEPSRRGVCP